jgi:hypothetical protein
MYGRDGMNIAFFSRSDRRILNGGKDERRSWRVIISPYAGEPWLAMFGQRPAVHAGRP